MYACGERDGPARGRETWGCLHPVTRTSGLTDGRTSVTECLVCGKRWRRVEPVMVQPDDDEGVSNV